jgi:hypothetical protein
MANDFSLIARGTMFQELHIAQGDIIQFIPLFTYFMLLGLFYITIIGICDGEIKVIHSSMGTQ